MDGHDKNLKERKRTHLELCLDPHNPVESGHGNLDRIRLPHRALPETDSGSMDLSTDFLGYRLKIPFMISCMTGGSERGRTLNRILARSAQRAHMAIGMGSFRVMLHHDETFNHFTLKKEAPDVPVLANIGAVQIRDHKPERIVETVRALEADGLFIHLNPGQEMFQIGGDRNFTGLWDALSRLRDISPFPLLVKETGCGIAPAEGLRLLHMGMDYVDISGSGGTDWIAVEGLHRDPEERRTPESFRGWGYSTAELLLAYRKLVFRAKEVDGRIIASGGIRTARDAAVSLACGAWMAAAALPFIRIAAEGGEDRVLSYVDSLSEGLCAAVTLSGAKNLGDFRRVSVRTDAELDAAAAALAAEVKP